MGELVDAEEAYLAGVFEPRDDDEAQYLERAAQADFVPDLLFADYPDTLARLYAEHFDLRAVPG